MQSSADLLVAAQLLSKGLVWVNCAAIPRELFESEFFGHSRGAFTGAIKDRLGRFELADGGTLFLDEAGEIPLDLQSKLLRVLQEGTFERVGEERTRRVNVRVIAAANQDLLAQSKAGRFRMDLYYRLSVFPIENPPLRDRPEDVPILAEFFLARFARKLNVRPVPRLTRRQVSALSKYPWPGDVRELGNVIERALILAAAREGRLEFDLPQVAAPINQRPASGNSPAPSMGETGLNPPENLLLPQAPKLRTSYEFLASCEDRQSHSSRHPPRIDGSSIPVLAL
jgi:transcriptional regulator with GAF, ATPase, and Fis domain